MSNQSALNQEQLAMIIVREGLPHQFHYGDGRWIDSNNYLTAIERWANGYEIRVKPGALTEFLLPPDLPLHNPAGLTADQITEGGKYRAVTKDEMTAKLYDETTEVFSIGEWKPSRKYRVITHTYRVPVNTPFPKATHIVEPPEIVHPVVKPNLTTETHRIVSAYRDAEGWILYGADQEPIEVWPKHWTERVTKQFLLSQGIEVEGEKPATEDSSVAQSDTPRTDKLRAQGIEWIPVGRLERTEQELACAINERDILAAKLKSHIELLRKSHSLLTECIDPSGYEYAPVRLPERVQELLKVIYQNLQVRSALIPTITTTDPDFGEVVDTRFEPDSPAQAREIIHRLRAALEKTACECHGPHICTRCETLHPEKLQEGTVSTPAR